MSEFVCSWCGVYCRVERVWRDDGELLNRLSDEPALLRVRDAELLDGGLDRRLGFRCLNPADILPLGAHQSARMAPLPTRAIRGTPGLAENWTDLGVGPNTAPSATPICY